MIVQVVIGQAKSIEIPQSFNATVFTVSKTGTHQYIYLSRVSYQKVPVNKYSLTTPYAA